MPLMEGRKKYGVVLSFHCQVSGQAVGATQEARGMTTSLKDITTKDKIRRKGRLARGESEMHHMTLKEGA